MWLWSKFRNRMASRDERYGWLKYRFTYAQIHGAVVNLQKNSFLSSSQARSYQRYFKRLLK